MRIISFAWTTPAVKARVKTCTRRDWNDAYAKTFKAGQHLMGYDRTPRVGGKPFQEIILTMAPYKEAYCLAPASDWEAEGFAFLESIGAMVNGLTPRQLWNTWRQGDLIDEAWVVRFTFAD